MHLLGELREFVDFADEDIEKVTLQDHVEQPLFLNTVGSWRFRPRARTLVQNLFVAGDYAQSEADLTCMEGAVSSGLLAAAGVLDELGEDHDVAPRPLEPFPIPPLMVAKYLGLPFMVALKYGLVAWDALFGKPEAGQGG